MVPWPGLLYTLIGIPLVILGTGQIRMIGVIYLFGPVLMAAIGFVGFCIFAALYNFLARFLDGIEFEIKMLPVAVNVPPIG